MKFWEDWGAAIKINVLVISSWFMPRLLEDVRFAKYFITIIYLAFLGGIIHLAGVIQNKARKRGEQQMYTTLATGGRLKDDSEASR
jgi:hypothetical protein